MHTTLDADQRVARDKINDSLTGLAALAPLYGVTFFFLHALLAVAMMCAWAAWLATGFFLRVRNPTALRQLVYFSIGSWILLVLFLNFAGMS